MLRKIPIRDGKLVCCACCQGHTELVIDVVFSSEYRLVLVCPKCGSNWNLVIDDWVSVAECWRSQLNQTTAELEEVRR